MIDEALAKLGVDSAVFVVHSWSRRARRAYRAGLSRSASPVS